MSYPILMVCGPAGSGKDTVAAMVAKLVGGTTIAQADPMKRLANLVFGFNEEQLWGPSAMRNAADARFTPEKLKALLVKSEDAYWPVQKAPNAEQVLTWMQDVFGKGNMRAFQQWYQDTLLEATKRGVLTPRYVLQTLGTEFGRALGPDVWVNYALRMAREVLTTGARYDKRMGFHQACCTEHYGTDMVVITDGRFKNEVLSVLALGGQVWHITPEGRLNLDDAKATATAGVAGHASEAELNAIPSHWYTGTIVNNKAYGLADLQDSVEKMVENVYGVEGPRVENGTGKFRARLL